MPIPQKTFNENLYHETLWGVFDSPNDSPWPHCATLYFKTQYEAQDYIEIRYKEKPKGCFELIPPLTEFASPKKYTV